MVHQSDFNAYTVVQARTLFGYFHRFIQISYLQKDIAGDGLLGLGNARMPPKLL